MLLNSYFIILASFLRLYKLDSIPASLNWDEVAAGYNAYTIANWGADEYGNKFPIVFTSFADDKHPVHIYLTSIVVKIFGLTDYNIRATSAGVGVLAVIAVFFLVKQEFLVSATFFLISSFLDIVDGGVAKVTGRVSKLGAYLDTVIDRYIEGSIILGLLFLPLPAI